MTGDLGAKPNEVEATDALAAKAHVDRALVGGMAWTAGVKWLSQLLTWPVTIIVVRLLSPEDYGLVAMGSIYIGLVTLINEFGLGSAIVKFRRLSESQVAQISGLCILLGGAGLLVSVLVAYPIAAFYKTPAVTLIIIALSANFLITSFKTVPLSLLQRDGEFRICAINEAVGAITQSVCLVAFALLGFRYWTLVVAALLSSVVTTVLSYRQRRHRIAWPRPAELTEVISFGSHLVGSRIGAYLYTNADFFIVGRVLGSAALGSYSFGWSLANMPFDKVTTLVARVAPTVFSAVQDDSISLQRYVTNLTKTIAFLTFPAGIGLALVGREFVLTFLGGKWEAAIVPLQILSVYAAFRSIVPVIFQLGNAIGLSRFVMRNSIASAIVLPTAFVIGSQWGTTGVALAWVVAYPLVAVPLCVVVLRKIAMPASAYCKSLWPGLSTAAAMVPAVVMMRYLASPSWPIGARLFLEIAAGALAATLAVAALHRSTVHSVLTLVRTERTRKA